MSGPPFSKVQILSEQINTLKELVKAQEVEISSLNRRFNEAITSRAEACEVARIHAFQEIAMEMNLVQEPNETTESAVLRNLKEMMSAPSTEEVEDMSHVRGKIEAYCEVAKALGMDIEATDVNKDNVISEIEAMMSKLSILKDVDFGILGRYVSAVRNLKEKRECLKLAKDRLDDIQIETSRAGDVVQNLRAALTSGFEDKKESE